MNAIKHFFTSIGKKISGGGKRVAKTVDNNPIPSFIVVLVLIVGLIIVGAMFRRPEETTEETPTVTAVDTYAIGAAPNIRTQAEIEKSGVIKVVAQSSGVVQQINVKEGQEVWRGSNIAWLSTNYQGGTAQSLQRKKAQESYEFQKENFDIQKDLVGKQRKQAEEVLDNAQELREISEDSISETEKALNYAEDLFTSIDEQIEELEQLEEQGSLSEAQQSSLQSLKAQRLQYQTTINSLKSSLRNTRYSTDEDNPPAELDELQRDITFKNLEVQEKSAELNKELAKIDMHLAQVQEALMYPASPCPGVVERVHVKIGNVVNPGDLIATITATDNTATAIAYVSSDVARDINQFEPATIAYDGTTVEIMPGYITREPVNGSLHAVYFSIPDGLATNFANGNLVDIQLPVGYAGSSATVPFIPVDSVYQTQDTSYVYVVEQKDDATIATIRQVQLGPVFGRYVQVEEGLGSGDAVILNRNVIENDVIQVN